MSEKKLFLLDGHALVYRAHFAFISRPLINSKGMNVSAITGFVRALWDVIKNHKPTHIAVSFDISDVTFRNDLYPAYKAQRDAMPEDIQQALPWVQKIIQAFNIPVVTADNFEADDVIGTLATQAEQEGFQVYMMTPDKDFSQLVSDNIFLYKPGRQGNDSLTMGVKDVLEQWGIESVDQVIEIQGLQGDSVDNIPGIPGIGPKTAQKLIAEYGTIENLILHSHELKGKQKERIIEFADQALLSKELAKINTEAPVKFDAKKFIIEPFNRKALEEIFKELEFRRISEDILGAAPQTKEVQGSLFDMVSTPAEQHTEDNIRTTPVDLLTDNNIKNVEHQYYLIDDKKKLETLVEVLKSLSVFCFDTETTSLDANDTELVGISFSWKSKEAWYVPCPADQKETGNILEMLKPVFENAEISKVGQNIKFDALVLKWYGIEVKGFFADTMLAHYLLEPELRHNMDYLAETYLNYKPVSIESLIGKKGVNQGSMRDVQVEDVAAYAGEDADVTWQLWQILKLELEKQELTELYNAVEEPLISVLTNMEFHGIRVDVEFLADYSQKLEKELLETEKQIYQAAGVRFNIASPKQVGEVLFDRLQVKYRWRKTKSGQYSTSEEKLQELRHEHVVIDMILNHRELAKLKSTYIDALPRMVNRKSNRVHSSFNQALASTGRLSSQNPNLQNIPIRTERGRLIRKAFVPAEGNILLAADYSQIELRLIAHMSNEEAMLEAFRLEKDIHRATAALVFNTPYEEVTAEERRRAKTVNFSIIYGAGATNLSQQLNISRSEAKALIEQYFASYTGLKKYMEDTVAFARKHGYVKTILGRKRHLRDINSRNSMMSSQAERMAINSPVQGSAADMIKLAMIRLHKAMQAHKMASKLILQVHDELVLDVVPEELEKLKPMITEAMRDALPGLNVPIVVDIGTGAHWLDAH
jgi:DNA polymerase I